MASIDANVTGPDDPGVSHEPVGFGARISGPPDGDAVAFAGPARRDREALSACVVQSTEHQSDDQRPDSTQRYTHCPALFMGAD